MAQIEDIKKLRAKTMASMIECRNALDESGGDFEKATKILREKGALIAQKKTERTTANGIISSYIHTDCKTGVLVELNCETDFVAKNEEFKKLGHEICMHIAAMNPQYVRVEDIPEEVVDAEKEIYREQFKGSGKPKEVIEKIIDGKLNKYRGEQVLLNQPYIRDDSKTIQDLINEFIAKLGENIQVKRFVRYQV